MDDFKTEKWITDDGRKAEKRVIDQKNENGQSERIIELHVEDERPLRLQQRVVEKSKPMVYERKIEVIDPKTGSVIEQKVEALEPRVPMQLVDHISAEGVSSQSIKEESPVTRKEMLEAIVAAIKATQTIKEPEKKDLVGRLNSLGLADEIGDRVNSKSFSNTDKILIGVIAALFVGVGYIVFFM